MFSSLVIVVGVVSYVLAVPAPILAPQDPPCIPQYQTPGAGQGFAIPLGPGMHYCDGSSGSNSAPASSPPSLPSSPASSPAQPAAQPQNNTTLSNPGSGNQEGSSGDNADDADSCDEGDGNDEAPPSVPNAGTGSSSPNPPPAGTNPGVPAAGSTQPLPGGNNATNQGGTGMNSGNSSGNATTGQTFKATITGYGGNCGGQSGSCGFLGSQGSYQGAVSAYWNTGSLPGQCGTCWQIHDGMKVDGNKKPAGPIGTAPIVVMIDNTCGADPSKPTGGPDGFQCNQDAQNPTDAFGSVTVVDLCADTGASDAFFGAAGTASAGEDGHRAGLALASITQVDCGTAWKGSVDHTESWTKYQASPGAENAVSVKPGHRKRAV